MHIGWVGRWNRPVSGATVALAGVLLCLAPAGCGGSGKAATAGTGKQTPIAFGSPSFGKGGKGGVKSIPVHYTCDGANTTPSFTWGAVPPNTASLTLLLLKLGRSEGQSASGNTRVAVKIEWAVTKLSPTIHAIPAGKLPHGARVVGKPYSICPPKGSAAVYVFQINAMSRKPAVGPGFSQLKLFQETESAALASGSFTLGYKRV
jgi:phosphatidylethanolamine-binding protein (PEBP) family uncharacterized protein